VAAHGRRRQTRTELELEKAAIVQPIDLQILITTKVLVLFSGIREGVVGERSLLGQRGRGAGQKREGQEQ
jgi:hypothetical protein